MAVLGSCRSTVQAAEPALGVRSVHTAGDQRLGMGTISPACFVICLAAFLSFGGIEARDERIAEHLNR